jgi:thiosulfate reductase cytochrome b subunit
MTHHAAPIRHSVWVRVCHWATAFSVSVSLMSGLQIFNAHPRLYWGNAGANSDPAVLEVYSVDTPSGSVGGRLRIGHYVIPTTGILGVSRDNEGSEEFRAFPRWLTIPSGQDLATARSWHFVFGWVLILTSTLFLISGIHSRHIERDLVPHRGDFSPRQVLREIRRHLTLRLQPSDAHDKYNRLQRLSYFALIFLIGPLILLTGCTLSPGLDAGWPSLLDVFGGRQSARSLHFIGAMSVVAFTVVHLLMVVLAGPVREIRGMITGKAAP